MFKRRLKLVGGVRAEQTNIFAEGPLTDPTRDYQRNSTGDVVHDATGKPVLIVPTTAGLAYSQLTFLDRGTHVRKEYLDLFPSLNATYTIRDNLRGPPITPRPAGQITASTPAPSRCRIPRAHLRRRM